MSENFQEQEQRKWESEEWYCVNEFLNKLSVPTEDKNGRKYSTVGRIMELLKMNESHHYPAQELSNNDWVNSVISKPHTL